MNILGAEGQWADEAAEDALRTLLERPKVRRSIAQDQFKKLAVALQRRLIQKQLMRLSIPPSFDLIELLRENEQQSIRVLESEGDQPSLRVLRDSAGRLRLVESKPIDFELGRCELNPSDRRGKTLFEGLEVTCRTRRNDRTLPKRMPNRELFDADKLGRKVLLRHWQPGDRFQPIGMPGTVKLQDFFTNAKISAQKRRKLALGTTEAGEIFWVEGMRISERFKLTSKTIRCLEWRWQRP